MKKKTAELEVKSNVPSIKKDLRDATDELIKAQEAFGDYSKEAVNAARKVAELKDRISEAKETADLFDPGNKMKAFGGAMQAVGAGFETAIGGMGLLGVEGSKLEETLLKVNSAIAFSDGISRLADSAKDFNRFKTIAVGAFNSVKGAIGATGIGLFLIAAGLIVANFDAIKQKALELFPSLGNIGALFGKIKEIAFGAGEAIKNYVLMPFKALGKVLQGDFKGALAEVKNGYNIIGNYQKGAEKERQDQQKAAAKERLANDIAENEKRLEVLKARGKDTYREELSILNQKKKLNSDNKEELKKLQQDEAVLTAGHQKKLEDIRKAANDKAAAEKKVAYEKDKAEREAREKQEIQDKKEFLEKIANAEKSALNELQDINAKSDQEKLDLKKQRDLAEIEAIKEKGGNVEVLMAYFNEKYFTLQQELDTKTKEEKDKTDLENRQKDAVAQQSKLDAIINDNAATFEQKALAVQQELDLIETQHTQSLISDEDYTKKKAELSKARKNLDELEKQSKIATLDAVGNALGAFTELVGEQTVAGKAIAVAQATISAYTGIANVWGATSPYPEPYGTIIKVASTVAVAASAFANVKKILAVKVPTKSGGGGGGAAGSPAAPVKPSVNFQNTAQTQIGDTVASATQNRSQEPVKNYVVLKDINTAAELDRSILNGAKF